MFKKFWPVSVLVSFFSVACNSSTEVNTVDPQASLDIAASKADGFFVCELKKSNSLEQLFKTSQIWIEHAWKYKLDKGIKYKETLPALQIVMKVVDFKNPNYQKDDFLLKWDIKQEGNGFMGWSNDVLVLLLKHNTIPDTLTFNVRRLQNSIPTDSVTFNIFR